MNNVHTSIGALEINAAVSFGDALLEQSALGPQPTNPMMLMCRHIDDATLEQAGAVTAGPPPTHGYNPMFPQCH